MGTKQSRHHVLHEATGWSSRPEAQALRTTQSLIPRIPRDIHDTLHEACPHVPLLGSYALKCICRNFDPTGDTMTDMDGIMFAIEQSTKHPKTHMVERDLGLLAIEAIDLQRPYVRKGLAL